MLKNFIKQIVIHMEDNSVKKSKRVLAVLMIATFCLIGTACFSGGSASNTKSSYIANEEEIAAAVETLGSDLSVMKISIDGVIYSFPMNVQFLLDAGWTFPEDILSQIDPYPAYTETTGVIMTRMDGEQEKELSIVLMNESGEKIPVSEAMVTTFSADRYQKHKMILPGGITWASSIDDVKAAYGEPTSEGSTGSEDTFINTILTYDYDSGTVRFGFKTENGETKMTGATFF